MANSFPPTGLLEIVVPVRNPGTAFLDTIASLEAQSDRNFEVLLSDNHSSTGRSHIEGALSRLTSGGIATKCVKPPTELSRVPHWNFAHHAATADWLKPLFAGDSLHPSYVAKVRERINQAPTANVVRCDFEFIAQGVSTRSAAVPVQATSLSPSEVLRHFPSRGNWLGSPVNFAYTRSAWLVAGGYSVHLPACADLDLFVALTLRHGLELLNEPLATFQLHDQRFSKNIRQRHVLGIAELWLILRQACNYCNNSGLPWSVHGVRDGVFRQFRLDYLQPLKARFHRFFNA